MTSDIHSIPPGDPSKVAMRVQDIVAIAQIEGVFSFHMEKMNTKSDVIKPMIDFGKVVSKIQENDTIDLVLEYSFAAASSSAVNTEEIIEAENSIFSAKAYFFIEYLLDSAEPASEDDLRAFAEINGRLNTIPYWREYLHNVLTRAGLPAYEVPPFNPVKIARDFDADRAVEDQG